MTTRNQRPGDKLVYGSIRFQNERYREQRDQAQHDRRLKNDTRPEKANELVRRTRTR